MKTIIICMQWQNLIKSTQFQIQLQVSKLAIFNFVCISFLFISSKFIIISLYTICHVDGYEQNSFLLVLFSWVCKCTKNNIYMNLWRTVDIRSFQAIMWWFVCCLWKSFPGSRYYGTPSSPVTIMAFQSFGWCSRVTQNEVIRHKMHCGKYSQICFQFRMCTCHLFTSCSGTGHDNKASHWLMNSWIFMQTILGLSRTTSLLLSCRW